MVDQNLLIIFVALTALAVLIQTGVLVGFYLLSTKLMRQADQAIEITRKLVEPSYALAENARDVSAQVAGIGLATQSHLRQFEDWWRRRTA